jgi:glycosyltransferase involved in cell wall biosynthesis
MIERMTRYFSQRTTFEIYTPSSADQGSKLQRELFGDLSAKLAVAKYEPDIVYSDNALFAAQLKVQQFLARRRIPLIVHLRGDWWREYWAWFIQARWPAHIIGAQHFAYQWFALSNARKVTPICRWLERIVKHYIPRKRTEVVYQGVDPAEFFEDKAGLEFKRPAVAIIQNHTIYPKVVGLLNLRRVVEQMPEVNFYITEGERFAPGYLPTVKEAYSKLENAHFIAGIDGPAAVRKVLTCSDLYVLASGLDCCPTTILEASLMRKPVLASRVGGVPEIVLEGKTGWTLRNDSYQEWVDKIRMLVEDDKLRSEVGNRGREWVSQKFGWRTIGRQVEQLISSEVYR